MIFIIDRFSNEYSWWPSVSDLGVGEWFAISFAILVIFAVVVEIYSYKKKR